ncbi:hypothetical protein LRAMOSA04309 [Lichtheimia ramosa]|uniref:Galactose oxidase n=1 Tax=Lichtheimia ramosa TaxID=688394 RepID=A0A077WY29_9FUNG|nr:hypothetical protein LRAMOSA04309 [Lichtheimia ramosa]
MDMGSISVNGSLLYDGQWTVIDTSIWSYNYPNIANPPFPRVDHTATFTPEGDILIIGGLSYTRNVTDPRGNHSLNPVSMSSLLKFNAATSEWQNVTATGNIPAPRNGHSAVLRGNHIVVFGGGTQDDDGQSKLLNDIFILELSTMKWSAPSSTGISPTPRKYHHARMVDEDLMLVALGYGPEHQGSNDIDLLDMTTWTWVSEYNPNLPWLEQQQSDNNTSTNQNAQYLPPFTTATPAVSTKLSNSETNNPHSPNAPTNGIAQQGLCMYNCNLQCYID